MNDPVLAAVVRAATSATGASAGWIVAVRGDELEVVAVSGDVDPAIVGTRVSGASGTAGYVVGSGQPMALASGRDDPRLGEGVAAAAGRRPASVVSVPCEDDSAVAGALELIDKAGGGSFSFDDVELATLLAGIAAAALTSGADERRLVPAPEELSGGLRALAAADPSRYATTATLVASLLARD